MYESLISTPLLDIRDNGFPSSLKQLIEGEVVDKKDVKEEPERKEMAISALGACISYLKELYLDKELLSMQRMSLYRPSNFQSGYLVLDSKTLRNLEIFENSFDGGREGTLLAVMDHCLTNFG